MDPSNAWRAHRPIAFAIAAALVLSQAALAEEQHDHAAMDHSKMDHSTHDQGRDELGRSLYNMKHEMDAAMMKELREKVALYRDYSDAEIALSMDMMGQEYAWYISPDSVRGKQGVLILTHGFREQGDKVFRDQVQSIANIFPTSLGIGMAMMMSSHIQVALDDLAAAGASEIVIVPVVSSASNELYRQWLYVFGKQDEAEFASVPRVKTDAVLKFVSPAGDNPLIAEILLDHAAEVSTDPKKEVVIIAGHGPSSQEDNDEEMRVLAGLAKIIQEDGGFSAVYGQTLQDDAPPPVRAANVKKLRALVEGATSEGKTVIVVTNLISARSIQAKLRDDLKGLEYKFNPKGVVQHPNFMKWMTEEIRYQFEQRVALR
jgi:sirohydrochlorin ferrochelatase